MIHGVRGFLRSLPVVATAVLGLVACGPSGTVAERIEANIAAMEAAGERYLEGQYWPTLFKMAEHNAEPTVRPFST